MIKFKLQQPDAKLPTRGSDEAAGLDLYACECIDIPAGKSAKINTGVCMEIPSAYVGLIWPRSKISTRFNIDILAGVIDSDYRGEIQIALINHGDKPFEVRTGDKIAQMIIQTHFSDLPIEQVDQLSDSTRDKSGINSSEIRLRD